MSVSRAIRASETIGPRSALAVAAALSLVFALVAPASATTLEQLSLASLRGKAEAIVVARVLSTQSVWTGDTIVTETVLAVEKSYLGPASGTVLLRTPGGRATGLRLLVRGAPTFAAAERVLLFLYRAGDAWRPVGMFQGVWRLDPNPAASGDTQAMMAWPSASSGARLVPLGPGPYAVDGGPRPVAELVGRERAPRPTGPHGVIQ